MIIKGLNVGCTDGKGIIFCATEWDGVRNNFAIMRNSGWSWSLWGRGVR